MLSTVTSFASSHAILLIVITVALVLIWRASKHTEGFSVHRPDRNSRIHHGVVLTTVMPGGQLA